MKPTRPAARPVPAGFVPVASSARPKQGLGPALQVTIGTAQRCPLCHDHLADDAPLVACAACLTVAHGECVDESARCSTLGCGRAPAQATAPVAAAPASRAWPLVALAACLGPTIAVAALLLRPVGRPDVIFVAPPPPPPPQVVTVTLPEPPLFTTPVILHERPLVDVIVPARTGDPNVSVRGRITRCSAGAVLEVTGPEGDVRLPASAGPFELLVTLPRPGPHRITVTLREPSGVAATVEQGVVLEGCQLDHDCGGYHRASR
jgi:hypothetical protein